MYKIWKRTSGCSIDMLYNDVAQEPTPWEVAIRRTSGGLTIHEQAVAYCIQYDNKLSFGSWDEAEDCCQDMVRKPGVDRVTLEVPGSFRLLSVDRRRKLWCDDGQFLVCTELGERKLH